MAQDDAAGTDRDAYREGHEVLGEIYSAGGRTRTPVEQAASHLAGCLLDLQADAGFIATVGADEHTVEVVRVTPSSPNFVRLAFPVDAAYPLAAVLRGSPPLYLGSNAEMTCDHPGLTRMKSEDHACATIPLIGRDAKLLGAMNVTFDEPRAFTESERILVREIASDCTAVMAEALG